MSRPGAAAHSAAAAELIAGALLQLKKAAGRKHAELGVRCQELADSITEV